MARKKTLVRLVVGGVTGVSDSGLRQLPLWTVDCGTAAAPVAASPFFFDSRSVSSLEAG